VNFPLHLFEKVSDELKRYQYTAKCLTCGEIFFDVNLAELKHLFETGAWDIRSPMMWYVKAGYHWVENPNHIINVILRYPSGYEETYYALSNEWSQRLQYEPNNTKQAMLNELQKLEKQLKRSNSECSVS